MFHFGMSLRKISKCSNFNWPGVKCHFSQGHIIQNWIFELSILQLKVDGSRFYQLSPHVTWYLTLLHQDMVDFWQHGTHLLPGMEFFPGTQEVASTVFCSPHAWDILDLEVL